MIIAISGIDGSGKSSLAAGIVRNFIDRGRKVKLAYLGDYILVGFLVKITHKVYRLFSSPSTARSTENPFLSTTPKSLFHRMWIFVVLMDNTVAYLRLKVYTLMGYDVVCDRYFHDRLAGFIYHGYCGPLLKKIYLAGTSSADIQFFLDQDSDTCMARETRGNHSLAFYNRLRQIYAELNKDIVCHSIDVGNKTQTDLTEEVVAKIDEINTNN